MYSLRLNFRPFSGATRQRGIGLIESVLATIVGAFILIMMMRWMLASSNDLRAKRNADSLQQFTQMASIYLDANRDGLVKAMTDGTGAVTFCQINANPTTGASGTQANSVALHTCALDANWLIYKGVLPAGVATTNPYGQRWIAIYKLVYADYDKNAGTPNTTQGDVEMLVVATGGTPTPADDLGLTMVLMGGTGGLVPAATWGTAGSPCLYTAATKQACGTNGWVADLSNFVF